MYTRRDIVKKTVGLAAISMMLPTKIYGKAVDEREIRDILVSAMYLKKLKFNPYGYPLVDGDYKNQRVFDDNLVNPNKRQGIYGFVDFNENPNRRYCDDDIPIAVAVCWSKEVLNLSEEGLGRLIKETDIAMKKAMIKPTFCKYRTWEEIDATMKQLS